MKEFPTSIEEASRLLEKGEITSVELTDAYLVRAKERNGEINAYLEVFDDARSQAKEADRRRTAGERGKLLGIPLAVKDNILIQGKKASAASKMLENYTAVYDATAIAKLKEAGVVFLGRTNMDEFAMGSSTENSAFGVVHNPYDTSRVPGGSSGGSAAAVADNTALASLGSDTGGSIRQPAALCGVVGLKPTYGSISRSGLMAMGSSLDQIGSFTKTVGDARILFHAMRGRDPLDGTSADAHDVALSPEKARVIGVPFHTLEGLEKDVRANFDEAVEKYKALGYEIREIELPNVEYALPAYYIVMPAEVSSNLARFDGVRYGLHVDGDDLLGDYLKTRHEGFGPEVRRRVMLGTYVLSAGYYDAYYNKAQKVRTLIGTDFDKAFADVGVILTPTSPSPAFKIGEKASDPVSMYLSDIFTVPQNLIGIPALSLPSGFVERDGKKLPLGIQLSAPHFAEEALFTTGAHFLEEEVL